MYKGSHRVYTPGRELGRGGEGVVYELTDAPASVLKIYNEPVTAAKARKLRLMAAMATGRLLSYSAWPEDVVEDVQGAVRGFVMRRLDQYYPLHMLFSPMDRKRIFPDKGYNFLVRVAANLSRAIHAIHATGLVMGDINEGNVLVNAAGLVAFIDCDSFQIEEPGHIYYCEVGVPRYTPPELLRLSSFDGVRRTADTDSFSLAVLVFQLLFLGRHPYAGRNKTAEDIDEEKAIRQQWFAYTLRHTQSKLSPPDHSFDIRYLPPALSDLFHTAFESTGARPLAADWIRELDGYEKSLRHCSQVSTHYYPASLGTCLWCEYREKRNILFFLDERQDTQQDVRDIGQFINGIRVQRLTPVAIQIPQAPPRYYAPAPLAGDINNWPGIKRVLLLAAVLILLLGFFLSYLFLPVALVLAVVLIRAPWQSGYTVEVARRSSAMEQARLQLERAVTAYNTAGRYTGYNGQADRLELAIHRYRHLRQEYDRRRQQVADQYYQRQLDQFLAGYLIATHTIPSIGPTRRATLERYGIRTAADISRLRKTPVQGIGPANLKVLESWQRQMASHFVYQPNKYLLDAEYAKLGAEMERTRTQIESEIRRDYHAITTSRREILERRDRNQKAITALTDAFFQAKADYELVGK